MKLIYMASAPIAAAPLEFLSDNGFEVSLIVCQPDKPSSARGNKIVYSLIKQTAFMRGIPLFQPESVRDEGAFDRLASEHADAVVVFAYGQLLPQEILTMTRLGAINIHASLLPAWRGAAPIARCLMNGDKTSGLTIMSMEKGLDSGDIYCRQSISVPDTMTAGELSEWMSASAGPLVSKVLSDLDAGLAKRTPQEHEKATYANKLTEGDRFISFQNASRQEIVNRIRGLDPSPGAWGRLGGKRVQLFGAFDGGASSCLSGGQCLTVQKKLFIAAGDGLVGIARVKPEGKGIMDGAAFANGLKKDAGLCFE